MRFPPNGDGGEPVAFMAPAPYRLMFVNSRHKTAACSERKPGIAEKKVEKILNSSTDTVHTRWRAVNVLAEPDWS
jgi:hypothetical protein